MTNSIPKDFGDLRLGSGADLYADVVIIGSGAGGSTVAATAVEMGYSVLMLEEGPYVPPSRAPETLSKSFRQLWRNGGLTVALGAPPVSYAEGRCVGGSTEINSAIFQRTPADLLDLWTRNYHIDSFNEESLAPYYDWAAQTVNASLTPGPLGKPSEILARVGQNMGWQVKELERGQRGCVGTNMCSLGCPTGGKSSMTSAVIPQLLDKGVRVISDTKVVRIKQRFGKATHLEALAKDVEGRRHKIKIHGKHFFSCAGAIGTPALLQRSGFKGVIGQKLRLHPTLRCTAYFKDRVDAQTYRLPLVAITEFMPDLRLGGSVFTPATFGLSLAEDWETRSVYADRFSHAVMYYAMVRGDGHGKIISTPNSLDPIVTYNLAATDWQRLGFGMSKLGQGLLRTGATHVFPSIHSHQGWQSESDAAKEEETPLPRAQSQLMTIHLFGSCPLGDNAAHTGVNSFGRVHNMANIYVADASLIPEAPGVNPQATVMALARRNALHVLESQK